MHEIDRHRVILSALQERSVVTVFELSTLTGSSEATVRRDISALDDSGKLRRVRGGAEAIAKKLFSALSGKTFSQNVTINIAQKQAIAAAAVEMCSNGESIIINGGTTTFQMVHPLASLQMQVFTNSFPIAEHLLENSKNTMLLSGGIIYREQNIILSPFENDVTCNFYAKRMFMGAQGVGQLGLMEQDPLLIQAEQKLIGQAEELVVLVDSSKFTRRSSLILCRLDRIDTLITDDGLDDKTAAMLEAAGITLKVVSVRKDRKITANG